jgi:hypothetical protein
MNTLFIANAGNAGFAVRRRLFIETRRRASTSYSYIALQSR